MELLRRIYNKLGRILREPNVVQRPIYNLNLDITKRQKRVAFVYTNFDFYEPFHEDYIRHSNGLGVYPKLKYFIEKGYAIDLYDCHSTAPESVPDFSYDIIFGFGKLYSILCGLNPKAFKILYITENAPWIVEKKFNERLSYYEERHGRLIYTIARNGYYTKEMFEQSDLGIAGNGCTNIKYMQDVLLKIEQIYIAAIFNEKFKIEGKKNHQKTCKKFVWFGSSGTIHKGLDILIDVFHSLPDFTLDIYGADPIEIKEFNLPPNVHNCGFVNVKSDEFIKEVVNEHSFVVSISCSEAFQSSVSTCMAHGLIPIVTPETGFDNVPGAIICKDFHIDYVLKVISETSNMTEYQLSQLEGQIYNFAREYFSVKSVDKGFRSIMNKVLNQ